MVRLGYLKLVNIWIKERTFAVNVFVRAFATVGRVQALVAFAAFEALLVPPLDIHSTIKVCGGGPPDRQWALGWACMGQGTHGYHNGTQC